VSRVGGNASFTCQSLAAEVFRSVQWFINGSQLELNPPYVQVVFFPSVGSGLMQLKQLQPSLNMSSILCSANISSGEHQLAADATLLVLEGM
jgi:hypothetical protein